MTASPLLDPIDAAAYLHVSRRTLERLVAEGRVRPLYVRPRRPKFEIRELDAYLASLRRRAA